MKKESEKTILDKLDEIGAPVRSILEGVEYKGFKPLEMPNHKQPNSPTLDKKKKRKKRKKKTRRVNDGVRTLG